MVQPRSTSYYAYVLKLLPLSFLQFQVNQIWSLTTSAKYGESLEECFLPWRSSTIKSNTKISLISLGHCNMILTSPRKLFEVVHPYGGGHQLDSRDSPQTTHHLPKPAPSSRLKCGRFICPIFVSCRVLNAIIIRFRNKVINSLPLSWQVIRPIASHKRKEQQDRKRKEKKKDANYKHDRWDQQLTNSSSLTFLIEKGRNVYCSQI